MQPAEAAQVILAAIYERLKPRSFKKKGRELFRVLGDVVHIVGLQGSQKNVQSCASFTVNIAILLPSLIPADVREFRERSIAHAHWKARLGYLCPERTDRWWSAEDINAARVVGSELASLIEAHALPEFERFQNSRSLLEFWRSGKCMGITEFQRKTFIAELERVHAEP